MTESFDVIIPVGVKDIFIVQRNVECINLYLNASSIYLISKKKFRIFFHDLLNKYPNVHFVDEDILVPGLSKRKLLSYINVVAPHLMPKCGWYFQQFLKMGFAKSNYCKNYYLIWDADTLPTRQINFFTETNRCLFCVKEEYHVPYFRTMEKLLGVSKLIDKSFIAEHMMIKTEYMNELIACIEQSSDNGTWWKRIIAVIDQDSLLGFSEFETYGTFVYRYYPESISFRELKSNRRAGKIYGRSISMSELLCIKEMDTISLEPADKPDLIIRKLWQFPQRLFIKLLSVIIS